MKKDNVEGGSPSPSGGDDNEKKTSKRVEKKTTKSEKNNMTDQKGYNEVPLDVPVKSAKKKA